MRESSADEIQSEEAEGSPLPKNRPSRPLRIWPVALLITILWAFRIVTGFAETMSMPVMMARFMGPQVCAVLILLWWLFFSRAPFLVSALVATPQHEGSIFGAVPAGPLLPGSTSQV